MGGILMPMEIVRQLPYDHPYRWDGTLFGGPRLWRPNALAGSLSLWLDAEDTSTITLNGSTVSQWADKSGNGRNAAQATAANQPAYSATVLNGKPGVTFDGVNDFLSGAGSVLTGNSQATICCVFTTSQTTTQNPIMVGTSTATATSLAIGSTAAKYNFYSWGIGTEGTYTPISPADTPIIAVGSRSPANINSLFINGNSGSSGNTGGINITSGYTLSFANASIPFYLAGLIAEVVVLPIEATTNDRQKLEGYLAWKWGLEANLPSNHPYKLLPPTV